MIPRFLLPRRLRRTDVFGQATFSINGNVCFGTQGQDPTATVRQRYWLPTSDDLSRWRADMAVKAKIDWVAMACLRFLPPLDVLVQHRTDEVISEASTTGGSCRGAPLPLGLLLADNFERSMQDGNPSRTLAHEGIEAARERIGSNLWPGDQSGRRAILSRPSLRRLYRVSPSAASRPS